MDMIPEEYAYSMHASSLHPYSQYITADGDSVRWTINALNSSAKENITDIIHFAGLKSVAESCEKPELYQYNNVEGSKTILKLMKEFGYQFYNLNKDKRKAV